MAKEQVEQHLSAFEAQFLFVYNSLVDLRKEEAKIVKQISSLKKSYETYRTRIREQQEQYDLFRVRHSQISGGRTIDDIISEADSFRIEEKARKKRLECSYCHDRSVHRIEDICSHCGNGTPYGFFK